MEPRNNTNVKRVLEYMKEHGSITSMDAIKEFGATRLSAIIYILKYDYGYEIKTVKESGVNRYGRSTTYGRYVLENNESNN